MSGEKLFVSGRCCKAWLIVLRWPSEDILPDASWKKFAIEPLQEVKADQVQAGQTISSLLTLFAGVLTPLSHRDPKQRMHRGGRDHFIPPAVVCRRVDPVGSQRPKAENASWQLPWDAYQVKLCRVCAGKKDVGVKRQLATAHLQRTLLGHQKQ